MASRPGGAGGGGGRNPPLTDEQREKMKAGVFSVIRATLMPHAKTGLPVEKLNREYREFTQQNIPYRDMGYPTLEDFLDQNPKLCRIAHKPTGWHVYGAVTQETKHIHEMVTSQKRDAGTSKRRAKPKPAPRPRFTNNPNQRWSPTPGRGGFRGGVGHAQGGGPGGYNYNQQQPSNQHRGGGIPPNQQNSGRQFNSNPQQANRKYPGGSGRFPGGAVNGGGNRNLSQQQNPKLRTPRTGGPPAGAPGMNMGYNSLHQPHQSFHSAPPHPHMMHTGPPTGPPHPAHQQQVGGGYGVSGMPPPPPGSSYPPGGLSGHSQMPPHHSHQQQRQQQLTHHLHNNQQSSGSNRVGGGSKNQQQYQQGGQGGGKGQGQQQGHHKQAGKTNSSPGGGASHHQPPLPADHYRKLLAAWLRDQRLEDCAYKTSPVEAGTSGGGNKGGKGGTKIVKGFLSTVIVNDKRYQTFPDEFPTAEEAEEAVSKIACNKLNITAPGGASSGHHASASNSNSPPSHNTAPSSVGSGRLSNGSSSAMNHQSSSSGAKGQGGSNNSKTGSDTDFGTWSATAPSSTSQNKLGDKVISRIVDLVGSRSNGVWSTQIEVEYKRKFKGEAGLPDKWTEALEAEAEKAAAASADGQQSNTAPPFPLRVDWPLPGVDRCIIYTNLKQDQDTGASDVTAGSVANQARSPQPSPITGNLADLGLGPVTPINMALPPPVPVSSAAAATAPGAATSVPPAAPPPPIVSHHFIPTHPMGEIIDGQPRPPPLALPQDTLWDVYVTWVNSTTNVRLRILGDSYSALFDELATNMELHYFEAEKAKKVERPVLGKLYAAKVEGDWHRVEVTHVSGTKITCYFIDHGDEDLFGAEDLRELDPKFLELAPQAKQVRLSHLENWKDSSEAQAELSNLALGKSLVAQLQTNDENGVSLVLYDTSSDEDDVNINQVLINKLSGFPEGHAMNAFGPGGDQAQPPDAMPPLELPSGNVSGSDRATDDGSTPDANGDGGSRSGAGSRAAGGTGFPGSGLSKEEEMNTEKLFALDLATLKPLVQTPPPNIDTFFDISICVAASPSNFTVQSYAEEKNLDELQSEMQAFYNVESNLHPESPLTSLNHLSKDSYFAGKHSDNLWYRVKVNSMLDEGTAAVKMVDFGDFAMIPLDKLQPLWPRYRNLPMQAINASLADIVAVNGDWSPADTVWFSQRVLNKQFVSKVKDVVTDTAVSDTLEYELSVSLFDTSDPDQDIVIDKELVDQGRAVYLCLYQSQINRMADQFDESRIR